MKQLGAPAHWISYAGKYVKYTDVTNHDMDLCCNYAISMNATFSHSYRLSYGQVLGECGGVYQVRVFSYSKLSKFNNNIFMKVVLAIIGRSIQIISVMPGLL